MTNEEIDKLEAGPDLDALVAACRKCGSSRRMMLKSGYTQCLDCHNERSREYSRTHRRSYNWNKTPAAKEYRRDWQLKKRYGLTRSEYESFLVAQDGKCAICQLPPEVNRWLTVDHCHETGIIRGLLCDACNVGLANFRDNPESLHRAIWYLKYANK